MVSRFRDRELEGECVIAMELVSGRTTRWDLAIGSLMGGDIGSHSWYHSHIFRLCEIIEPEREKVREACDLQDYCCANADVFADAHTVWSLPTGGSNNIKKFVCIIWPKLNNFMKLVLSDKEISPRGRCHWRPDLEFFIPRQLIRIMT